MPPECLADWVDENNPVRAVDVFIDALKLAELGFDGVQPLATGRLVPDHKTIADFRKDNGPAIKKVCAQFVELCRKMGLPAKASVAIDGSSGQQPRQQFHEGNWSAV
jgi:transposase